MNPAKPRNRLCSGFNVMQAASAPETTMLWEVARLFRSLVVM